MVNIILKLAINEWNLFLLFFLSIIVLIFLSELVLKRLWSNHTNRKIIHIAIGIAVSLTPYIFTTNLQPVLLALVFFIINLISYQNNMLKSFHSIDRNSYGTIFFPASYLLIAILFWNYPGHLTISFLILAISDPFAYIIGNNVKNSTPYNILGDKKTIQGSVAMFICSLIIVFILSNYFFNHWNISYKLIVAIFTGLAVTLSEALSYKGSDNLTVPITAFLFIELFDHINKNNILLEYLSFVMIIVLILFVAYKREHLSTSGFIGSSAMAVLLLGFGGYNYLFPLVVFFITSSMLSQLRKQKYTIEKKSNRNISQVYANGGVALFICIINYFYHHDLLYPCFLVSVAAANSDTWGTELGRLSNKEPVDIISGYQVTHGESGGITPVGTIGSILGSLIIGIIGSLFIGNIRIIILVIISGFLSSIIDSILGSSVQARYISQDGSIITEKYNKFTYLYTGSKKINNDIVNLYCTISGPLIFLTLYYSI